jgi:hypothetical protein
MGPRSRVVETLKIVAVAAASLTAFSAQAQCTPEWKTAIGQPGMSQKVYAATVWNGELVVGGQFEQGPCGETLNRIARWDGLEWRPIKVGNEVGVNGTVRALTVFGGDLIAAGNFSEAGGEPANNIARCVWDPALQSYRWHPLVSASNGHNGVTFYGIDDPVRALTVWDGHLYIGGYFDKVGSQLDGMTVNGIAMWNGSEWYPLQQGQYIGVGNAVFALTSYNNELVVGGWLSGAGGQTAANLARWTGTAWITFPAEPNNWVYALCEYDGQLVVGGNFDEVGSLSANHIAVWNGTQWGQLGQGVYDGPYQQVLALAVSDSGDSLFVGGTFERAGAVTANNVAEWDSTVWNSQSSGGFTGVGSYNGGWTRVWALAFFGDDVAVGGELRRAGGQVTNYIATWGCPDALLIPGDANGDGCVNQSDMGIVLAAYGSGPGDPGWNPAADVNDSCGVGQDDLGIVLANYGQGDCP